MSSAETDDDPSGVPSLTGSKLSRRVSLGRIDGSLSQRDQVDARPEVLALLGEDEAGTSVAGRAAFDGDQDLLWRMLDEGVPIDAYSSALAWPLGEAIKTMNGELIRALLLRGAAVNVESPAGETPVLLAVLAEAMRISMGPLRPRAAGRLNSPITFPEVLSLLVTDYGADINHRSMVTGYTALTLAIEMGLASSTIEVLVRLGASTRLATRRGVTPLMAAAGRGEKSDAAVINFLVQTGADVNATSGLGKTALMYAARSGSSDVVQLLLDLGAAPNAQDHTGRTALHEAARRDSPEIVRLLVQFGACIDSATADGSTPLLAAVAHGGSSLGLIKTLLVMGADPNFMSEFGDSPLSLCVSRRALAIAQLLCESGADPTVPNMLGQTALERAVAASRQSGAPAAIHMVRLLATYAKDEDVAEVDELGTSVGEDSMVAMAAGAWTGPGPLSSDGGEARQSGTSGKGMSRAMHAEHARRIRSRRAKERMPEEARRLQATVEELITRGDMDGIVQTVLASASVLQEFDLLDTQTDLGHTMLIRAAGMGHSSALRNLIAMGANVDSENATGTLTPLLAACEQGQVDAARTLIRSGANVNECTSAGKAPLVAACYWGNDAVVHLLVEEGADPNLVTPDHWTPLTMASARGHISIVRYLVGKRVDVNCEPRGGASPLVWAVRRTRVDVVRFLLDGAHADPEQVSMSSYTTPALEAKHAKSTACLRLLIAAICKAKVATVVSQCWEQAALTSLYAHWKHLAFQHKPRLQQPTLQTHQALAAGRAPTTTALSSAALLTAVSYVGTTTRPPVAMTKLLRSGKGGRMFALSGACVARYPRSTLFVPTPGVNATRELCAQLLTTKLLSNKENKAKGLQPYDFPDIIRLWFKDKFRLWTLVNKHLRAFADGVLSHMRESEFLRHVGILTGLVDSAAYSFRVAEAYVYFAETFLPSETRFITLSKGSGTRIKTAIVFDELQKWAARTTDDKVLSNRITERALPLAVHAIGLGDATIDVADVMAVIVDAAHFPS